MTQGMLGGLSWCEIALQQSLTSFTQSAQEGHNNNNGYLNFSPINLFTRQLKEVITSLHELPDFEPVNTEKSYRGHVLHKLAQKFA
jgi:hypothetical protein